MLKTLRTVRRASYRTGSVLGDVIALRSPGTAAKRFLLRKPAYRAGGKLLRKLLP